MIENQPVDSSLAPPDSRQIGHRLLQVAAQIGQMQAQIDHLAETAHLNSGQLDALLRTLTDVHRADELRGAVAEVALQVDAGQQQVLAMAAELSKLARQDQLQRLEEIVAQQDQLAGVEQALTKWSRTQFKSNALGESKEQQIETALAALQAIVDHRDAWREQRVWEDRQQVEAGRQLARSELAVDLLPALDGLELAIASGQVWLEENGQRIAAQDASHQRSRNGQWAEESSTQRNVWQRLRQSLIVPPASEELIPPVPEFVPAMLVTAESWLEGLKLVRMRLAGLLAAEGIQPIDALGQSFDPRLHVALETESRSDVPANIIVRQLRKGYRQHDRVLRYAEVVVSRAPEPIAQEEKLQTL